MWRVLLLLLLSRISLAVGAAPAQLPAMREPVAADRVLVVSPHPDDESLCCAGYIQRAVAAGAQVTIVWMTAGDGFELDALVVERHMHLKGSGLERLGLMRMNEARGAGRVLGVAPEQMIVLGYPDRGLRALLGDYYSAPYRSRYTRSL
ncbi:MAG: PIG-L family deacetylase, partial [Pseudomonadota bacterium]